MDQPPTSDVDPHRLAAAMEAAGFLIAGRGLGHIRFAFPGDSRRSLVVPLDVSAEGDADTLADALADLAHAAAVGDAARKVLDALATPDPSPAPPPADTVASRLRHAHQTSPLMRRAQREEDGE